MEITHINISEALLLKPSIYEDERGSFMEAWNLKKLKEECSLDVKFVQENHSSSKKGVLRGLHYQSEKVLNGRGRVIFLRMEKVLANVFIKRKSLAHVILTKEIIGEKTLQEAKELANDVAIHLAAQSNEQSAITSPNDPASLIEHEYFDAHKFQ